MTVEESKHVAIKHCICYSCVDGSINNKVNIQTHNGMTSFKFQKRYDEAASRFS